MPLKIVFLDVDGVLNCEQTFRAGRKGEHAIDDEKVKLVADLVARTGSRIVISSTWRKGRGGLTRMRRILRQYGLVGAQRLVIGITPDLSYRSGAIWGSATRGEEIAAWLKAFPAERFVILDDDGDMGPLLPQLVRTNFTDGLTPAHIDAAVKILT